METLNVILGNERYTLPLPRLLIQNVDANLTEFWEQIKLKTGLEFKHCYGGMEAQPETSGQIVKLLISGAFKSCYYNNGDWKNVIKLKKNNNYSYSIDSICYDCAVHNNIEASALKPDGRLSC